MRYVPLLMVIALLVTLLAAAATAYARPPDDKGGCDPWPTCKNGGDGDITVENFRFDPQNFPEGDDSFPADGTVDWFNEEGRHNVSICNLGTAVSGVCATEDVILNSPGDLQKGETGSFDFTLLAAGQYNYFCRFHGISKEMFGTVTWP